jgi:hypothetical protein
MRIPCAFLAATFVPALLMIGWYAYGFFAPPLEDDGYIWVRIGHFAIICIMTTTAYVLLLGVPAFLLLRWKHAIRWWSSAGAGLLLGALPLAIWAWPLRYSQPNSTAFYGGVQIVRNGVPTLAGWFQYASGVGFLGLLGAIGGISFWLVWYRMSPNYRIERTREQ